MRLTKIQKIDDGKVVVEMKSQFKHIREVDLNLYTKLIYYFSYFIGVFPLFFINVNFWVNKKAKGKV